MTFWLRLAHINFNLKRMNRLHGRFDVLHAAGRHDEADIILARLRLLDLQTEMLFQRIEQRAERRLA